MASRVRELAVVLTGQRPAELAGVESLRRAAEGGRALAAS